jgi:ankyrin repeat protein
MKVVFLDFWEIYLSKACPFIMELAVWHIPQMPPSPGCAPSLRLDLLWLSCAMMINTPIVLPTLEATLFRNYPEAYGNGLARYAAAIDEATTPEEHVAAVQDLLSNQYWLTNWGPSETAFVLEHALRWNSAGVARALGSRLDPLLITPPGYSVAQAPAGGIRSNAADDASTSLTWLELASFLGADQVVLSLLEAGHMASQPSDRRGWPLGLAMWREHHSPYGNAPVLHNAAIEILISAGADPCAPDPWGRPPLNLLIDYGHSISGHLRIMLLLLKAGANPNGLGDHEQGGERTKPLLYAVGQGEGRASVDLLLRAGANPMVVDHDGESALHLAVRASQIEGASADACELGVVDLLLAAGLPVDLRSWRMETPLMLAVGKPGRLAIGRLLLERGAAIDPDMEWSMLMTACGVSYRIEEVNGVQREFVEDEACLAWVELLLNMGIDVNIRHQNRSAMDALMETHTHYEGSRTPIMRLLLARGWHPDTRDSVSIERMVISLLGNRLPTLDDTPEPGSGSRAFDDLERSSILVEHAIANGWMSDPALPHPSLRFRRLMGSRWEHYLLDQATEQAGNTERQGSTRL